MFATQHVKNLALYLITERGQSVDCGFYMGSMIGFGGSASCRWTLSDSWNCTASLGIVSGVNIGVEVSGSYKVISIIDQ